MPIKFMKFLRILENSPAQNSTISRDFMFFSRLSKKSVLCIFKLHQLQTNLNFISSYTSLKVIFFIDDQFQADED